MSVNKTLGPGLFYAGVTLAAFASAAAHILIPAEDPHPNTKLSASNARTNNTLPCDDILAGKIQADAPQLFACYLKNTFTPD